MKDAKWLLLIFLATCFAGCATSRIASFPPGQSNVPQVNLIVTTSSFVWWPFGHNIGEIVLGYELKLFDYAGKTRVQCRVDSHMLYAFAFSDESVLFIKSDYSVGYHSAKTAVDPIGFLSERGLVFDNESGEVLLVSGTGQPFILSKLGEAVTVDGSIAVMSPGADRFESISLSRAGIMAMLTKN